MPLGVRTVLNIRCIMKRRIKELEEAGKKNDQGELYRVPVQRRTRVPMQQCVPVQRL